MKIFFITLLGSVVLFSFPACSSASPGKGTRDAKNLQLLEQNVESADTFFVEGKEAFLKNEYANAIESLQKSSYSQALFYIGLSMSGLGKPEEAKDVFKECVKKNILVAESYYNLSIIYYDLGDASLAKEQSFKALENDPEHIGALFFAGNLFYVENNMEEALKYYLKAVKIDPGSTDLWEAVFSVYLQKEEYQSGWEIRDKIDRSNPETVLNVLKIAEITRNYKEGVLFAENKMLEESSIRQQIRILLTKGGDFKKAVKMAASEAEKTKKPYIIIDRSTDENGSYVIGFQEKLLFIVCSKKSEEIIPVEMSENGIKIKGMDEIPSDKISAGVLDFCSLKK